ncbi:MAG: hypothetical protein ACPGWR_23620 [Ardenticatenaceae bacterium]
MMSLSRIYEIKSKMARDEMLGYGFEQVFSHLLGLGKRMRMTTTMTIRGLGIWGGVLLLLTLFYAYSYSYSYAYTPVLAEMVAQPTILEVQEGDNHAIIYWNSKTAIYDDAYDPDKQQGIYSYRVEWGEKGAGFPHSEVTPFRVFLVQPLEPGVIYEARVYNIDNYGNLSLSSQPVEFQHDASVVEARRERMNGFFDDFNQPMGTFDELKWNTAFSGCVQAGQGAHHINHEFHAHTMSKSSKCDRAVVNARPRDVFDFTDRTGTIEFDLDGSKRSRQLWYLDLYPAGPEYSAGRKRDISGHVALDAVGGVLNSDPAHLLRIVQTGTNGGAIQLKFADAGGRMKNLRDFTDIYRNGACGWNLKYCEEENLSPVPNVRRRFRIDLSKTDIRIFINEILVLDASLEPVDRSGELPYERADVVWLLFSYNTTKDNLSRSVLHWDNFGFDAPANYEKSTVIHNYTDGRVGPAEPTEGTNDKWGGPKANMDDPVVTTIPIPDPLLDTAGVAPKAELMFTLQGDYVWPDEEQLIVLNEGTVHEKRYTLPKPSSEIRGLPFDRVVGPVVPYSALLPIDIASSANEGGLIQGDNELKFYFDNVSVFNIHVELTYPIDRAPSFTQPSAIFADYAAQNMPDPGPVGPGLRIQEIDRDFIWNKNDFASEVDENGQPTRLIKTSSLSGHVPFVITGNVEAQMTATGHATGISRYEILLNQQVIWSREVNRESPVAYFNHQDIEWDTTIVPDGTYELFMRAYDPEGNPSFVDFFQANSIMGEYIPILVTVNNSRSEVLGTVELQGTGERGDDELIVPLSIQLTERNKRQVSYNFDITINNLGQYTLKDIEPGVYDMQISSPGRLPTMQRITLVAGSNQLRRTTLLGGDANHDNHLSLLDFSILSSAFYTCQGDATYQEGADLDKDECITFTDLSLLSTNFGRDDANPTQPVPSSTSGHDTAQDGLSVLIAPLTTTISVEQPFTVTVQVQAGSQLVDGSAAYLHFDPTILQVQQITNSNSLPLQLQNSFDNQSGTIRFMAGATSEPYPTNTFDLMQIEFMPIAPTTTTTLQLNNTMPYQTDATFAGASILASTNDATIRVQNGTSPNPTTLKKPLYLPLIVK